MKIGSREFNCPLLLAPMAGYTDRSMRLMAKKWGADLTVTEMVSAKAVVYKDKKTFRLAKISADEGDVLLQIFGSEPSVMAEAAARLALPVSDGHIAPFGIDINMGCPVNKIFSNGEGSALMKSPTLIYDIVSSVRRAIDIPLTVKMRLGIKKGEMLAVECALAAEEAGAEAICIHGRRREDMYGGEADREGIRAVKEKVKIPLIANGDITDADSALGMLRETGADGLAVGRGAVGNPFIFREIKCALSGDEFIPPTNAERIEEALRQLSLAVADKGEEIAIPEARKQIALYLREFRGSARLRAEINASRTYSEVARILRSIE